MNDKLPDDPRDLEEDQLIVKQDTGEAWRVMGFEDESGLPRIRREEESDIDPEEMEGKRTTACENCGDDATVRVYPAVGAPRNVCDDCADSVPGRREPLSESISE